MPTPLVLLRSCVCAGLVACALAACTTPARAVVVDLPTIAAARGDTVTLDIAADQPLGGLGIYGIEYTLTFDPAVVSAALPQPVGAAWTWGPPFANVTSNAVLLAAAGATPVASPSALLHRVRLVVSGSAPNGSSLLSLTRLRFNEGSPAATQVSGFLQIGTVDVASGRGAGAVLAPVSPNPARGRASFAIRVEDARRARVAIFDLHGRRVRGVDVASLGAGTHALSWDGRDDAGAPSPAGVYAVRLEAGGTAAVRRFVWLR